MIYKRIRKGLLRLLKAPEHPPDPPAGSPESVRIFRAAPNFLKLRMLVWGAGFAAGLLGEVAYIGFEHFTGVDLPFGPVLVGYLLLAATLLGFVGKFFLIRIDYDMRYYVVTDRSLRIREGALHIDEATFTFANVQNLKIHQGPLERLLGLSNLVVETAGGAGGGSGDKPAKSNSPGHQGVLRGVSNAKEIRDQMLALLKCYRDAGLGDPEDRCRELPAFGGWGCLSPESIDRLREIRDELRRIGKALDKPPPA